MYYQRKLHDVFCGKSVAARARRAAFDVAAEADAEIARLQAQADGLRTGLDVWSATAGRAQARNVELQAHADALAVALRKIATIGNEDGLSRDEYQQRLIASAGYARVALTTAGRWSESTKP